MNYNRINSVGTFCSFCYVSRQSCRSLRNASLSGLQMHPRPWVAS